MITRFRKEDVAKLLSGEETFAQELSLIADKVRVVWSALGYNNWTSSFEQADDCVEKLFMDALEALKDNEYTGEDFASFMSQCVEIEAQFDEEGYVNISYKFVVC